MANLAQWFLGLFENFAPNTKVVDYRVTLEQENGDRTTIGLANLGPMAQPVAHTLETDNDESNANYNREIYLDVPTRDFADHDVNDETLVYFDYANANEGPKTRVGNVIGLDANSVLLWDVSVDNAGHRRFNRKAISNLHVLDELVEV